MTHANAPLTPLGRQRLAELIVVHRWPVRRAAERYQCSPATASKWAARANRPVVKSTGDSASAAAWSAVHDWQETARTKRSAPARPKPEPVDEPLLELIVDLPSDASQDVPVEHDAKPRPKPVVAAAAKRKPTTVQASTTPRKPSGTRVKKNKRVN